MVEKSSLQNIWVRVDGKNLNLERYSENEKVELCKEWHRNKHIECLCNGPAGEKPPILHIRYRDNTYYFANNSSNKGKLFHSFDCPYNPPEGGYRQHLKEQGIEISDMGVISCNLSSNNKKQKIGNEWAKVEIRTERSKSLATSSVGKGIAQLRTLFLTILKETNTDIYKPNQSRKIGGRIYNLFKDDKVLVHRSSMKDKFFVAMKQGYQSNFKKHEIIVGWGNRNLFPGKANPTDSRYINIPILSLTDKETVLFEQSVYTDVYNECTYTDAAVSTGYWVLWKERDNVKDKLFDRVLIFVPAEEHTMIPVDSSYEETMIKYLVDNERYFLKPVIGNVSSKFTDIEIDKRPDMLLKDTKPYTVIEVAGIKEEGYRKRLAEKREYYLASGYQYSQWDGDGPIILPNKDVKPLIT